MSDPKEEFYRQSISSGSILKPGTEEEAEEQRRRAELEKQADITRAMMDTIPVRDFRAEYQRLTKG